MNASDIIAIIGTLRAAIDQIAVQSAESFTPAERAEILRAASRSDETFDEYAARIHERRQGGGDD